MATDNYVVTTITAAATSFDLTTLARAKAQIGITSSDQDDWLRIAITAASRAVAQYCNREFALQTYQDVIRARKDARPWFLPNGRNPLATQRKPLVSVTSVVEDGVALVANTDYEVDLERGYLYRLDDSTGDPRDWPTDKIVIVYKAGYTPPGLSGLNALLTYAPDIEDAVIRVVKSRWYARTRDPFLKGEQVEGIGRTDYWVPAGDDGNMPPDARDILGNYRTPAMA